MWRTFLRYSFYLFIIPSILTTIFYLETQSNLYLYISFVLILLACISYSYKPLEAVKEKHDTGDFEVKMERQKVERKTIQFELTHLSERLEKDYQLTLQEKELQVELKKAEIERVKAEAEKIKADVKLREYFYDKPE